MYPLKTRIIAGLIFLPALLSAQAQTPEFSAKAGLASSLNLGNVNNLAVAPHAALWGIFSDSFEAGLDLRLNVNQLVWNGLGASQSILAADSAVSATINLSEQFIATTELNYAAGDSEYSRWGMAVDLELDPVAEFSLYTGFSYDAAEYLFNTATINQSAFAFQAGFVPHLTATTDVEAGLSYSSTDFSTTQDNYSLYRLKGALRQQLGNHFLTAGISWGGDSSDYALYGVESSLLWNMGSGLSLYNLVQLDYFTYSAPSSGTKGGKRPGSGSSGRKFNPQSTADSFVSFLWYASLAKTLDF